MRGWIGVDLDGTLAHYDGWQGIGHVGEPIKPMCDRVRFWLSEGQAVKIFTARVTFTSSREVQFAKIPIQAFSQREFGTVLPITNIKDFDMIELWDDRAIQVRFNTGEIVG